MPLRFEPPTGDPREWLALVEEEVARQIVREITSIATDAVNLWWNSLTASGDYGVFDIIPQRWNSFVNGELVDTFAGIHTNGSVSTFFGAPGTAALAPEVAFQWVSVVNTEAVSYARTMPNRMVNVGDHLWNDLTTKISGALESGDVRDRLRQTLQETAQFSRYRAELVARTEVTRAFNAGTLAGAQALGEFGPVEKVWISGLDERTRETHVAANDQVVGLNDQFQVGDALMDAPGDGPPEESCNCRCSMLLLYPGDTRPDGSVVPEVSAPAAGTLGIAEAIPMTGYGPGPASVQKFSNVVQIPRAAKGRAKLRAEAMRETVDDLDRLHGMTGALPQIDLTLGGAAGQKGGHFTPATRGARPKRTRGMSSTEWNEKAREYNSRPLRAEIRVNDFDIEKQMSDFTHELGHATDWDGAAFRSRRAWTGPDAKALQSRYGPEWLQHLDEVQDTEARLFLQLGKEVREAESVKKYLSRAPIGYRQYFQDVAEVWARSYAQWAAEASGNARLLSAMAKAKESGIQFSDAEFARIKPVVEGILRERGLMR
jgi:hypothetical protein